jgi:hypothetical protein
LFDNNPVHDFRFTKGDCIEAPGFGRKLSHCESSGPRRVVVLVWLVALIVVLRDGRGVRQSDTTVRAQGRPAAAAAARAAGGHQPTSWLIATLLGNTRV